jgi:hypothetical protein
MIEYAIRVYPSGTKRWYLNGQPHREDGPAVEWPSGSKEWYLNGQLHRKDGPAIEWSDGYKSWYLNGEHFTEEEHKKATESTVEMTREDICKALGKNVKVVK